ncbi:tetratricopeptide repeat protein [Pyxidicoccus sp. 3LG]
MATGAYRAALAHCQRSLKLDEQTQGAESPDVALDLACLGEAQLGLGAPERALPLLERARSIHEKAWLDRRDSARTSFLLARALWTRRAPEERTRALELAKEARDWLEAQGLRTRQELRELVAWQEKAGR